MKKSLLNEVILQIANNKETIQNLRTSISDLSAEQKEIQERQRTIFNKIRTNVLELEKLASQVDTLVQHKHKLEVELEQEAHEKAIEAIFVKEPDFYDALATRLEYQQSRQNDGLSNLEHPIAVSDFTKKIRDLAENPKVLSDEARLALSARNLYLETQRDIISKRLKGQALSPNDSEGRKNIIDNFLMTPSIYRLWS